MKNLIFLFAVLVVMASCHNYKKDTQNLLVVKDSLLLELKTKDSSIQDFLNGYKDIQANLDSIKKMEKMLNIKSNNTQELSPNQKMMILEDIQIMNELLQNNKKQIVSLQNKLKSSNTRIGEQEVMLNSFKKENQVKEAEIQKIKEEVQNRDLKISQLSGNINSAETENTKKAQTIETQTNKMNQAFFTLGSEKELKEKGILQKTGGFLGIGRTPVIENDFEQKYFTSVDIREFNYVPLMVKKVKILSVHSSASFHISGERKADTLFIDNKNEFWKATKYLIIIKD